MDRQTDGLLNKLYEVVWRLHASYNLFFFNCCLFYRAEGHPPPDTYYVDQVKNALHQIEALDIPSVCESR